MPYWFTLISPPQHVKPVVNEDISSSPSLTNELEILKQIELRLGQIEKGVWIMLIFIILFLYSFCFTTAQKQFEIDQAKQAAKLEQILGTLVLSGGGLTREFILCAHNLI